MRILAESELLKEREFEFNYPQTFDNLTSYHN